MVMTIQSTPKGVCDAKSFLLDFYIVILHDRECKQENKHMSRAT